MLYNKEVDNTDKPRKNKNQLQLKNSKPWVCVDCSKLLALVVVQNTEYGKSTAYRIKYKDHAVLIDDPTSFTTVSIICRYCLSVNQYAPVGDPRALDLLKKLQEDN